MPGWGVAAILTLFAAVAAGLFVVSLRNLLFHARVVKVRVTAQVIALVPHRDPDDPTGPSTYAPVYRFTAADGKLHEVEDSLSSYPARYDVGELVEVVHPEGEPQRAAPPRQGMRLGATVLTGLLTVVLVPVAALAWFLVL